MRAEELLEADYFHLIIDSRESNISVGEIEGAMKEYARLKCQELLEIVAEKVKKTEVEIPSGLKIITTEIDKDSIRNAVDLDSFIS